MLRSILSRAFKFIVHSVSLLSFYVLRAVDAGGE